MKILKVVLFAVVISLLAGVAIAAEDYPTKPIRMIVPFNPGGSVDFVARIISPRLGKELGQPIVIENRSGASGCVGVEVAAHAKPDGYTLLIGNNNTIAINPYVFPKFSVKPLQDLIAVTEVADIPGGLAVNPSLPVKTLNEFIEYAKARPGKLNYGSSGAGSTMRIAMEFLMNKAGINIIHVPYKSGTGAVMTAVVGGEVNATFANLPSILPHVKAGKLRLLAVVAPKPLAAQLGVPTMAESGFPELAAGAWHGVYMPAGTPKPIVNKLFNAIVKTATDPEVVKRFADSGTDVVVSKSPEEFAKFTRSEVEFYAKVIKAIGIEGE